MLAQATEEEKRYNAEKREIEQEAQKLEHERDLNREKDPYFNCAEVLLRIAIAISPMAILSTSRSMFLLSLVLALCGTLLSVNGYALLVEFPLF